MEWREEELPKEKAPIPGKGKGPGQKENRCLPQGEHRSRNEDEEIKEGEGHPAVFPMI